MPEIPADLSVSLLKHHFFSRTDRAAVQRANGKPQPVAVDEPALDALLLTHVLGGRAPAAVARCVSKKSLSVTKGHFRLGSYTPALDGTTAWLCLDIDGPGHAEAVADPDGAARAIVARCKRYGLPVYLERSGGGKGWHVWALFAEPVPAATARKLACVIVPKDIPLANGGYADPSKQKGVEVFPKQDKIGKDGYGNLVWLPWWSGARDGGNQFYECRDDGLSPFVPESFTGVTTQHIDAALERAAADALADAYDALPLPGPHEEFTGDWKEWRRQALAALPLESVYGEWLTGNGSGAGWLECRDPDSASGDRSPSAGVADTADNAERGAFHSFITGKTLSVFDFMVAQGLAVDFPHALRRVAELSGKAFVRDTIPRVSGSAANTPRLARPSRPAIQVNNRQLDAMLHDAWQSVFRANKGPDVFTRHQSLVQLRHRADGPCIEDMTQDAVVTHLAHVADWVRVTDQSTLDTLPSRDVARSMLVEPHRDLPELECVLTSPVFGESGSLIARRGYHPTDKAWYEPDADLDTPDAPDNPSPEDIAAARTLLLEDLAGDFPFVSDADRAHWLAAVILPFVRRLVTGPTPLHFVEAPCNGAGKTLLCDLVALIATGRTANAQTLPTHDDEAAKTITAELLDGKSIVLLDNQNEKRKLASPPLASALTAQYWKGRLLGQSRMLTLPNHAVWLMTGNNPSMTTEMARRCLRIRIDPRRDRAWQRDATTFRHPDIKEWTVTNRGRLIHAVHVLVKAWLATGKPAGHSSMGSFEKWARVIGGILEVAGVPGFLECLDEMYRQADPEAESWHEFVAAWWDEFADTPRKVSELNSMCEQDELLTDLRGDRTVRSQEIRLGIALNTMRDRVFGDLRVCLVSDVKQDKGGRLYKLVREDNVPFKPQPRNGQTTLTFTNPEKPVQDTQNGSVSGCFPDVFRMLEPKHPEVTSPVSLSGSDDASDGFRMFRMFEPVSRTCDRARNIVNTVTNSYTVTSRAHACAHEEPAKTSGTSGKSPVEAENRIATSTAAASCEIPDVEASSPLNIRQTSGQHPDDRKREEAPPAARATPEGGGAPHLQRPRAAPPGSGEAWEDPDYVEPTFPDGSRIPDPWDPDYDPAKDPYANFGDYADKEDDP